MLGKSGSPEAATAYRQLQVQILTDPTFSALTPQQVTVDDLCLAYLKHAQENDPDHYSGIKTAVEILVKHYTGQPVDVLDTPYQLRHSAITDIALQTKSLDVARAVAGQKSISVTQRYNHADVKIAVEQAVKRSQ